MKKSQKLAALFVLFGMLAVAIAPVSVYGPWPIPDDPPSNGGNLI